MEQFMVLWMFVFLSGFTPGDSKLCGGHYYGPTGVIRTPNYPNNYSLDTVCEWIIETRDYQRVELNVKRFQLEPESDFGLGCSDSLEIRDENSTLSPLIGTYCGENIPKRITGEGNRMYLKFVSNFIFTYPGFDIEWSSTPIDSSRICGGHFYAPTGVIRTPNYPNDYPRNTVCEWIIETTEDNQVELEVVRFQLESCPGAFYDYLEVRDGNSMASPLIARYCNSLFVGITSSGNQMYLKFVSDASRSFPGFDIKWSSSKAERSSEMTTENYQPDVEESAEITWDMLTREFQPEVEGSSDMSTENHRPEVEEEAEISWDMTTENYQPEAERSSEMTTENYQPEVEGSAERTWDMFTKDYQPEVEGSSDMSTENHRPEVERNLERTWMQTKDFRPEESSDMSTENHRPEVGGSSERTWDMLTKDYQPEGPTETNQETSTAISQPRSCGGTLTTMSGSISSPNYPRRYSPSTECDWEIRVSAGNVILLRILDLDLEEDGQCNFDYLEIYLGLNRRGKKFGKYCDGNHPIYIQTTSNVASIRFRSDSTFAGRGFYINYHTVCHNKLHGFRGVIESPNFPNSHPHRVNCSWIIEVPMGNQLNLTFSHFDLEAARGDSCLYDYLEVKEGKDNRPNRKIGKFCNTTALPREIVSTQRQVFLHFLSDSSISNNGFRLEWVVNGCGGLLTQPEGTITSPGYPKRYSQNIDCEWTIEVKNLQSIEITFMDINLGKPPICFSGRLTVYNGADQTARKLIDACQIDRAITSTSTGNKLFVKLHIDHSDPYSRFKATYKSVDIQCGGRFTHSTGLIDSTKYPLHYSPTQNCEWLIQVPVNYLINLTFSDFDIQYSKNCSQDHVKIFDGSSRNAPVLGFHCSNALPPSYISSSHELLVVREADSMKSSKGFKATYELACGGRIVTDDQGTLSVDFSVGLLNKVADCTWTIVAQDPDNHVTFTLQELRVLSIHTWRNECQPSSVQIFEGETTDGPLLGKWCSTKIPIPITSQRNALTIKVTSLDGALYNTKFSAFYSVHNPACGGNHTSEHGTIASPNYPNKYPKNVECIWHLRTSPGNPISLNFKELNLIESWDCSLDSVEVREENSSGKLIGVYCGNASNVINSPKSLWIKFKSSAEGNGNGFIADYSLAYRSDLSGPNGEIASPLYPESCVLTGEYFWRILVEWTSSIEITFRDLHIEQSVDECANYIVIYDGYDENAPKLLTQCGVTLPGAVRSSSNVVYIKFFTQTFRPGSWFFLSWSQVPREYGEHDILFRNVRNRRAASLDSRNKLRLH